MTLEIVLIKEIITMSKLLEISKQANVLQMNDRIIRCFNFLGHSPGIHNGRGNNFQTKGKPLFFFLCQTLEVRFENGYTISEQKCSSNIIISNNDFLGKFLYINNRRENFKRNG